MGLTVATVDVPHVLGSLKATVRTITFDSSYPTGGESLTAADLGLDEIVMVVAPAKSGYSFEFDYTNNKLKAYWVDTTTDGAAQAEVANTTDLSSLSGVRVLALGR